MKFKNKLTKEQFEHEFLKGELYKNEYNEVRPKVQQIINNPDFQNPEHNRIISNLLWALRKPLLERLPNDIEWWEAELELNDFDNLLIIREIGWENTFGLKKKMKDVGQAIIEGVEDKGVDLPKIREIQKSIGKHPFAERLILISDNSNALPTVIEGNHRAVAFALEKLEKGQDTHLPTEVIIGISANIRSCVWWNWV